MRLRTGRFLIALLALPPALGPPASEAHDGPPYPILVDRIAGPYRLSVWADPDVGTGTFLISLDPAIGAHPLERCEVTLAVRPADGHRPETRHPAETRRTRGTTQAFEAKVPFDQTGAWDVRIGLAGPTGSGQAEARVEVTPPGQGPILDFVLYLFPFAAVAFLFVKAALSRKPAAARAGIPSAPVPRRRGESSASAAAQPPEDPT